MTGSVADLVRSLHKRTGFPESFVAQRARHLQTSGRLKITAGRYQPPARARDCANLLFGLTADKAQHAPNLATELESLERIDDCEPIERRAGDYLERLVARLWAGNREDVKSTIRIVVHPEAEISVVDSNGYRTTFYQPGTIIGRCGVDTVNRVVEFPAKTLTAIGADLGHKACAYAV